MTTKCNYSYEKIKRIAMAMESRLVAVKNRTPDEAKMIVQDIMTLLYILSSDKKLVESLSAEGDKIYE